MILGMLNFYCASNSKKKKKDAPLKDGEPRRLAQCFMGNFTVLTTVSHDQNLQSPIIIS